MKIKYLSPVIAALCLGLTACENTETTTPDAVMTMSLAGSEWSPEDMRGDENPPFVQFRSEGQLSGFAGCNTMSGTYTQDGDALSFGPIATTRKMCPDAMENETYLLQALNDTELADISHLKLELINYDGELLMTLIRNDPD